jgi:hypothetical protein
MAVAVMEIWELKAVETKGGGNQGGQRGNNNGAAIVAPVAVQPKTQADATTIVPDSLSVNASGTWNYTLESPQGPTTGNFALTKENGTYKGTISSARMPQPAELTSTTVNGNELTMNYTMNFNGTTWFRLRLKESSPIIILKER